MNIPLNYILIWLWGAASGVVGVGALLAGRKLCRRYRERHPFRIC